MNPIREKRFSASILVHDVGSLGATLKRLALFCDEIVLFFGGVGYIQEEVLNDRTRVTKVSDHEWKFRDFQFIRDTGFLSPSLQTAVESCDPEMRDFLQALVEGGVIRKLLPGENMTAEQQKTLVEVRSLLLRQDMGCKDFNDLTGTKPEDYATAEDTRIVKMRLDTTGREQTLVAFTPPRAVAASLETTTFLITSESQGYSPILLTDPVREVVRFRYRQFRNGGEALPDQVKEELGLSDPHARFGETAYLLSNSLFAPEAVARKTVKDILKYREELADARNRFLTFHVMRLSQLVEEEPWSDAAERRVRTFIDMDLQPALLNYQDEAKEIGEKLFGGLAVNVARAASYSALGAGGGGFLANILPGTSFLGLLAIGALAGTVKEAPAVVKTLVDYAAAMRKHKRNSVAYIGEFR